jgi:hypothetical protein
MTIMLPAWLLITMVSLMAVTAICELIDTIMKHILKKYYTNLDLWYSLKGGDEIFHTDLGAGVVDICYREAQHKHGERMIVAIFNGEPMRLFFDFHSAKIIKRKQ